jgi:hypothetical protein
MYDIFFVSKKEINNDEWEKFHERYPLSIKIENLNSIDEIKKKTFTKMFWIVWNDLILDDSFDLTKYRATKWDNEYIHVFKNGEHHDGVCLFPKDLTISKKEFDHRFFINKKEINQQISVPKKYEILSLSSYSEYLKVMNEMSNDLFWNVWPENDIIDQNIFQMYFSHHNFYDRNENHVFKHQFRGEETFSNGVILFSKNKKISKREFDHRFLIEKKEHDILASKFKSYDIVFISYNEPNADENYNRLLKKFPRSKRVDKVKGIHQAHIKAAELSETEMFWVVDGDAVITEDFNFDYETSTYERDIVHVWRSQNPINNLIYGYGGVKLLPRKLTLEMDVNTSDMTTAISKKFKAMTEVSNITAFDTDPFNTWKSAFRECVKLSSRVIERQNEKETKERLDVWCSIGNEKKFGLYAIKGAIAGRIYGEENKENTEKLKLINDFDWLKAKFDEI